MMIVPMILQRFKDALTLSLMTDIEIEDPTRAVVVKIGRWQDDATVKNIYCTICGGDPEDPSYRDGIVTLEMRQNIGYEPPAREIGGGQAWWRRGVLQVGIYPGPKRPGEEIALEWAYNVLGRMESVIENTYVADLVDDFGERALYPFLYANTFFESGGPPADFIFRGKVFWTVLTERGVPDY